ncbi:hypothetical protein FOXB_10396 [Fusarium oxysporum f. sp. conglutinans Fo5176]|uniref:Reverse transcriptase domain-containing protein n=1 Tax=Fusarium oxysporum (strain Fo5176) TaxID=660025 RepID=F9FVG5_FUSOF|nr:hypothetical protein FOXB_10396 [Fusarium oxysporum f. sp. conglutinans Fo5176]
MEQPRSKSQERRLRSKLRKEQLARQMSSPPDLSVVQINVKAAPDRIQSLKNWIQNCDLRIDILCLQDIPANIRGIQFSDHILAFGPNNPELIPDKEEGRDQTKGKKKKPKLKSPYQQKEKLHAVAYLIHKSIPVQDWHVEFHDNVNLGLAATLLLRISDDQTIAIHNVHNRFQKVQIPDLLQKVTATGQDLLVGDFNLHHPDWGGDDIQIIELQAIELSSGLKAADMKILTPRGFKTYSRGKCFAGAYTSTIDLTCASSSLAQFVSNWSSPEVPGFDSDHRVIMTTLDLEIERVPSTYYLWKLVDPKEFREFVNNALEHLGFPTLSSPVMADNYARRLVQAFGPAIQKLVPLAPPPGSKRPKNKPTLVTRRAENLLRLAAERELKSGLIMPSQQHYKTKRLAQSVIRIERAAAFYRKLSQDIAKHRKLYFWAKAGAKWNQKASKPIRQLKAGNLTHRTPDGMAGCVRDALWPDGTSDEQQVPPDQPAVDPERTTLTASQDLTLGDVQDLIARAPTGKAAGPDLLAYEGMKMAQKELLPYLHHLFAACLRLGHHPAAFKQASTVMLRKPDKDDYEQPKSWRPVALLPCMGKLLEKIFTHRLKLLALDHNLLPNMQFGTPGKCTTKALQFLLNNVYAAWVRKDRRLATLMGLDITGAYDRVDRVKLMKILEQAGIPDWMLRFIWSFLTDRNTDMRLPGFTSSKFWVNIGIPQGSPLSPILFLFFSMPILGTASEYTNSRVTIYAFAYVDDTYLLAVSDGYEANCQALKECHDRIMVWADSVGVSFSPHKYHVMHFLPPYHRADPFEHMPGIPGLEGKKPESSMRILGVEVDHKLRWGAHVEQVIGRVYKKMNDIARISSTTAGPNVISMRRLYITTVRPIISYACGAWFIYGWDTSFRLAKAVTKPLTSIESYCLRRITGALNGSASETLNKEAYVENILVFLNRVATTQRASALKSPGHETLVKFRQHGRDPSEYGDHPYHALDIGARRLLGKAESSANASLPGLTPVVKHHMRKIAMEDSEAQSSFLWDEYCADRIERHSHPSAATEDKKGWGPHNLKRYRGLSRAQSTILIQCRTEHIGLNAHLARIGCSSTSLCPCNYEHQTVYHMFIECVNLAIPRRQLYQELGHRDFYRMLSDEPDIVADWAISHFDIPQFEGAKQDSRFNSVASSTSAAPPSEGLPAVKAWLYVFSRTPKASFSQFDFVPLFSPSLPLLHPPIALISNEGSMCLLVSSWGVIADPRTCSIYTLDSTNRTSLFNSSNHAEYAVTWQPKTASSNVAGYVSVDHIDRPIAAALTVIDDDCAAAHL